MLLKKKIYNHYLQLVNDRINMLQQVLAELKEAGANETKSTAGDKYETALAMIQIEQANKRAQLDELVQQKQSLEKINPSVVASQVVNGSLIKTSKGYLFLSVALGRANVGGIAVTALSAQSPLGAKLTGLRTGDKAIVNNNEFLIESIE